MLKRNLHWRICIRLNNLAFNFQTDDPKIKELARNKVMKHQIKEKEVKRTDEELLNELFGQILSEIEERQQFLGNIFY